MEKKTAEQFLADKDARIASNLSSQQIYSYMEEYSSLQSEEKDKEIERLREALSDLFDHAPNEELLDPNSSDFNNSFKAAIVKAKAALSNQPIESDKDRRIKELQHLLNEALDFTTSDDELNGRIRKALNP